VHPLQGKALQVHRVGNHRDLLLGNAPGDDVALEPLADGGDGVGLAEHVGLQGPCEAVAQPAFPAGAVIHGRILPEGAALVDHGKAVPLSRAQRRQPVEAG